MASERAEGKGSPEYVDAQRRPVGLWADGSLCDVSATRFADVGERQTKTQLEPQRGARAHPC